MDVFAVFDHSCKYLQHVATGSRDFRAGIERGISRGFVRKLTQFIEIFIDDSEGLIDR